MVSQQRVHNVGLGSINVLNLLNGGAIEEEEAETMDVIKAFIWELMLNKKSVIAAATKVACTIFSIDETTREELVRPFWLNASVSDDNSKIADSIMSTAGESECDEDKYCGQVSTKCTGCLNPFDGRHARQEAGGTEADARGRARATN